jgi:hypothetical protein
LTKEGLVRTKIVVDDNDGYVKFKNVNIVPKIICAKIRQIEKLIKKIDKYEELVNYNLSTTS